MKKYLFFLISICLIGNFSFAKANENDETLANKKIEVFQNILNENIKDNFNTFRNYFLKGNNYNEKGKIDFKAFYDFFNSNLSMDYDLNVENLMNYDMSGSLSGKFDEFTGDFSTDFSLKSIKENFYVLVKNLKFSDNNKVLKNYFSKMKEDVYYRFQNKDNSMYLNTIIQDFIINGKINALGNNLLKYYYTEGNKLFLIPTKEACDLLSFHACDDSDYKDLLKNYTSGKIKIFLMLGNKNTLLGINVKDNKDTSNIYFVFDENRIKRLLIVNDFNNIMNKGKFKLDFGDKKYLNIEYKDSSKGKRNKKNSNIFEFKSQLDNNNNYTYFKGILNTENFGKGEISLNNNILLGNYNYINKQTKEKGIVKITGNTKNDNTLNKLNILYSGYNKKQKNPSNTFSLEYNDGNFTIKGQIKNNYIIALYKSKGFIGKNLFNMGFTSNYKIKNYDYYSKKTKYNNYKLNSILNIDFTNDLNRIQKLIFNLEKDSKKIFDISLDAKAKRVYDDTIKVIIPESFEELNFDD